MDKESINYRDSESCASCSYGQPFLGCFCDYFNDDVKPTKVCNEYQRFVEEEK